MAIYKSKAVTKDGWYFSIFYVTADDKRKRFGVQFLENKASACFLNSAALNFKRRQLTAFLDYKIYLVIPLTPPIYLKALFFAF